VEGIFEREVREKKNQAFLNKARTGAKGGSRSRKGMNTPFDYMSRKEKKNLNGEVASFNMHTILNWTEFQQKDRETQKLLLTKWREIYPNAKIQAELSVGRKSKLNSQSYADIVNDLGIPKKVRSGGVKAKPAKSEKPQVVAAITAAREEVEQKMLEFEQPIEEPKPVVITNGLHLEYNGVYDADQLNKIFTKLQLLVDGEENKFNISISLTEKV
jgi:hypothetical protein